MGVEHLAKYGGVAGPAAEPGLARGRRAAPTFPTSWKHCTGGGSDTYAYFTRANVVVSQEIWPTQPDRSKVTLLVTVTAPK